MFLQNTDNYAVTTQNITIWYEYLRSNRTLWLWDDKLIVIFIVKVNADHLIWLSKRLKHIFIYLLCSWCICALFQMIFFSSGNVMFVLADSDWSWWGRCITMKLSCLQHHQTTTSSLWQEGTHSMTASLGSGWSAGNRCRCMYILSSTVVFVISSSSSSKMDIFIFGVAVSQSHLLSCLNLPTYSFFNNIAIFYIWLQD